MTDPIKRKPGRPSVMKTCVVCNTPKQSKFFPPVQTASNPDRCRDCSKLATAAKAAAKPQDVEAKKAAKKAAKEAKHALAVARRAESEKARSKARTILHQLPWVEGVTAELEERRKTRAAMDQITDWFKANAPHNCECCFDLATGQDSHIGRHWCTLCGWGIERTGRCLAHPAEIFIPGLPQDAVLPPELLSQIRPPMSFTEAPPKEPGEE